MASCADVQEKMRGSECESGAVIGPHRPPHVARQGLDVIGRSARGQRAAGAHVPGNEQTDAVTASVFVPDSSETRVQQKSAANCCTDTEIVLFQVSKPRTAATLLRPEGMCRTTEDLVGLWETVG